MTNQVDGRVTSSEPVRAVFCNVVEGRKYKEDGKEVGDPRHDIVVVLTEAEKDHVKAAMMAVAKAKWPDRELSELKFPIMSSKKAIEDAGRRAAKKGKDAAEAKAKAAKLYPEGHFVLKAASKMEPALSYVQGGKIVEYNASNRATAKKHFYNGCFVAVSVNFVPYVAKKLDDPDGVTAYLDAACFLKDGERIGGVNSAERFKNFTGSVSAEDPTEGYDESDF